MNIYLVRHGLSTGNVAGILQGCLDTELTPEGLEQARRTADFFSGYALREGISVTALYTSTLKRAFVTAQTIGQALELTPQPRDDLREIDMGAVQGMTLQQFETAYPELVPAFHNHQDLGFTWPGGDNRGAFRRRAVQALGEIVDAHEPGDNLIVVTHGGIIHAYLNNAGLSNPDGVNLLGAENCGITHVSFQNGESTAGCLIYFNRLEHLDYATESVR